MPERSPTTATKATPADSTADSKAKPGAAPAAVGATGAAPPRRKPGKAEPIPLKWKLVGIADGMIFTLLKAVEKPPVEAELARLLEGASRYEQMEIYPIDAKVPIPASTAKRTADAVARATTVINPRPKLKRGAPPRASKTAAAPPKKAEKKEVAKVAKKKDKGSAAPKKPAKKPAPKPKPKPQAKSKPKTKPKAKPPAKAKSKPRTAKKTAPKKKSAGSSKKR